MLVFHAVVIMCVYLHDARSKRGDGLGYADRHVRVTQVKADAD